MVAFVLLPLSAFVVALLPLILLPVLVLLTCLQLYQNCSCLQGAFILGRNNSVGYPLLDIMAVGVLIYACWRFWEGITGQGSDDAFGPFKNFFRYRLSPLVSVRMQQQHIQMVCEGSLTC